MNLVISRRRRARAGLLSFSVSFGILACSGPSQFHAASIRAPANGAAGGRIPGPGSGSANSQVATAPTATPTPDVTATPAPAVVNPALFQTPPTNSIAHGRYTMWLDECDLNTHLYQVVIQVTLPDASTPYAATDLSGSISGTDTYSQTFSDGRAATLVSYDYAHMSTDEALYAHYLASQAESMLQESFSRNGNLAQLSIQVPCGDPSFWQPTVVDTVNVTSQAFGETDEAQITFQ